MPHFPDMPSGLYALFAVASVFAGLVVWRLGPGKAVRTNRTASSDIEASMKGVRRALIENFRSHLVKSRDFTISKSDPTVLSNGKCAFQFFFERRSGSKYVLFVSEPHNLRNPMSFVILRHVVGAKSLGDADTPIGLAKIVNRYFPMLLDGDFSIRRRYAELENRILDGFQASQRLSSDDPIRRKMKDCDLSWLDDIETRFRN
jgi:hypothetical protein